MRFIIGDFVFCCLLWLARDLIVLSPHLNSSHLWLSLNQNQSTRILLSLPPLVNVSAYACHSGLFLFTIHSSTKVWASGHLCFLFTPLSLARETVLSNLEASPFISLEWVNDCSNKQRNLFKICIRSSQSCHERRLPHSRGCGSHPGLSSLHKALASVLSTTIIQRDGARLESQTSRGRITGMRNARSPMVTSFFQGQSELHETLSQKT